MATAQRTRPRAVVGVPRSVATKICFSRNSVGAAPRTVIFYIFFTNIAGELSLYVRYNNV